MTFQEDFAKTPFGPTREQLVYRALISQGKPTDLWPVTVDGPEGTKITYYITRDFLKVGNQYVPMTGTTAQKVANYFGMYLPSNTIADQVWKAATAKINVAPLSGTGYRGEGGVWYGPNQVVSDRISASDAAVEFSRRILEEQEKHPETKNELTDIGSGAKWITMPPADNSLGLHGIRNPSGTPSQGGYGTWHKDYENHAEYGALVRLVDNKIDVTYPDGRKERENMADFIKSPLKSALFVDGQDVVNGQLSRYNLNRDKANLAQIDKEVSSSPNDMLAQNQTFQNWEQVDKFLSQLESQSSVRRKLLCKLAETGQEPLVFLSDQAYKDPRINTLADRGIAPPEGFKPFPPGWKGDPAITQAANQILAKLQGQSSRVETEVIGGSVVPFKIGDKLYAGRVERHWHPLPWGDHWGVTIFQSDSAGGKEDSSDEEKLDALLKNLEKAF